MTLDGTNYGYDMRIRPGTYTVAPNKRGGSPLAVTYSPATDYNEDLELQEAPMTTPQFTKAQITSLASQLARAQKYIAELESRFIPEPPNNGTVVRFVVTFPGMTLTAFPPDVRNPRPQPQAFSYAAIRAADKWYLTGQNSPQELEWVELLAWLDEKTGAMSEIEVWPAIGATAELVESTTGRHGK